MLYLFTFTNSLQCQSSPVSYTHLDVYKRQEFIFARINAGSPFFAFSASRSIRLKNLSFIQIGATISLFQLFGSEYPESILNTAVASSPKRSSQVKIPQSV